MITTSKPPRPFPVFTTAQRYHIDVHGYVIILDVLTPDEGTVVIPGSHKIDADEKANIAAAYNASWPALDRQQNGDG